MATTKRAILFFFFLMKSVMNIWKETVNWTDDKVLIAVVASGAQRQFRKRVSMEEYY